MQNEQFFIGDMVRYATTGVCEITDITEMTIAKKKSRYYVLQPVYKNALQVYVPCDNDTLLSKMRRLLSREEIMALIASMPKESSNWIEDELTRKATFQQILTQGDRQKLIGMIRSIYLHKEKQQALGKRLHQTDERSFMEAQKLLSDEFAYVLGIQPEEVTPFIIAQLAENV